MVTIVDFVKRKNSEGEVFNSLILQGGVEMVKSSISGRYYATAKRTSVTSTLDDLTCKELIGTQIPGSVKRVECEPYQFVLEETGEKLQANHRWVYMKEGETVEEQILAETAVEAPSS